MATKIDIVRTVARNLGDLVVDAVPASMTASTIDCTSLFQPNAGQLTGKYVYFYEGAASGQSKVTGSFSPTNKRLSFPEGLGSIPSVNSKFLLTLKWSINDYNNAFYRAVGFVRTKHLVDMTGTTVAVATQYEYPVPSGMQYVHTLRLIPSGNTYYPTDEESKARFEIPPHYWRIERNAGGTYCIAIDSRKFSLSGLDNHLMNIMGQSKPYIGTTDTSAIPDELEEYLIAHASSQLASNLTTIDGKVSPLFYMYRDQVSGRQSAPGLEDYVTSVPRGKKIGS